MTIENGPAPSEPPQRRVHATREAYAERLAFIYRSSSASMITCDDDSGEPLFAHWLVPRERTVEYDVIIMWAKKPDSRIRTQAEIVTGRLLLSEIRFDIDHNDLPKWAAEMLEGDRPVRSSGWGNRY